MPWLQIGFTVAREQALLLEAALENAGALAVTLEDAGDDPLLEPLPGRMPLWDGVRLTALFDDQPDSQRLVRDLVARLGGQGLTPPLIEHLEDRRWERIWLDDFHPTRFGRRLWICPQGQRVADRDAVIVDLDPGLAFGTGRHPATALCLEWLDSAELAGRTLLDYGCGSGILAIAALKLGAHHAIALDHDPQALEATGANGVANGVAGQVSTCLPEGLDALADQLPVDVVLANILARPLVDLAPTLLRHLRPGGSLVLSGVLTDQVAAVSAAYDQGVELGPVRTRDGWVLITGVRR